MHAHNKLHAVHYERKRLMSARLEWLTAAETTPDLLRRGDEASDHTEVTGPFAMVLGHPDGAPRTTQSSKEEHDHVPVPRHHQ